MLEVKNLYSGYDGRDILKDISFKVKNGEIIYNVEGGKLFKVKAPEGTEVEIRDTNI